MPAFEPAKIEHSNGVARPAPYLKNGRRLTALSWGGLNVKLRKPYRYNPKVLRRNKAVLLTQGCFFVRCTNSQGQRYA